MQEQVPEPAVEQVQGSVLHAAVVPVHRHPVFQRLGRSQRLVVVRIAVAQEIPAAAGPLGHGVGFALGVAAALGALAVDPVGHLGQGGFAGLGRLVVFHLGQQQGQILFIQGHHAAVRAVHNRDGLAPIALTGKHPVAQLIVDLALAKAMLLRVVDGCLLGLSHGHAVKEAGVDHRARRHIGIAGFLHVFAAGNHLDDGQVELLGKVPVALVVSGHGHDGACAVGHEHVVAQPDGNGLARHGVDGAQALDFHARLILIDFGALKIALALGGSAVIHQLLIVFNAVAVFFNAGMLGRKHHIGSAEQRIRAGGEHADFLLRALQGKVDLRALAAADPVALGQLYAVDKVHVVQAVQELLRIGGNAQHPLALLLVDDGAAAALAHALYHFFIGQHALAARAPVDGHIGLIGQAVLVHLQENPLRPLVILGIGGVDLPVVIKGEAQHLQLLAEVIDIALGYDGGVDMILDGKVLRRQAESVPADGVQHVVALHALFARHDIQRRVGAGMADVQAYARGIGEFDQRVILGLGVIIGSGEGLVVGPDLLPLFFNPFGIVEGNLLHGMPPSHKSSRPVPA